ncbi:hypothetical protein G7Y89_g7437 [Cudoniella acicularis]|uniref:Uncharacterized protein n=1 Tax=Cudoniella acicularis TaxID=354080 RepID=A0A8H4W1Z2_9HELO|nr:hypothetical protein G7Y89_g7437 [Cudoniella acicularis]
MPPKTEKLMEDPNVMYFQLGQADLQKLAKLTPFAKQLVICLFHVLHQGLHLADEQSRTPIDTSTNAGALCEKYTSTALKNDLSADKLLSLRKTGPSMKFIIRHLTFDSKFTAQCIFQLCIWRAFAFGNLDHLSELSIDLDSKPPEFDTIKETICKRGGQVNILISAYGSFQIGKSKVPNMLEKFWELSIALEVEKQPCTFAEIYDSLWNKNIPSLPQGGLLVWLIACDLAEFGVCLAPNGEDLAKHMLEAGGKAAGPTKGLKFVGKTSKADVPSESVEDLASVFDCVMEVFSYPDEELEEIAALTSACESLQGRKFSVADLEHGLCKIAREDTMRIRMAKKKGSK